MIKYGLMCNGEILSYDVRGDEFNEAYELSIGGKMWLVDTPEHANYVRFNSTPWYNASYDTPINCYDGDDLSVVEVEINVREVNIGELPSFENLIKKIYKDEPRHVAYVLETFPVSQRRYSLYDYKRYLGEE